MARIERAILSPAMIGGLAAPKRRRRWGTYVRHLLVGGCVAATILPLLWVSLLSVRSLPDAAGRQFWPRQFDFSHYGYLFSSRVDFPRLLMNSVVVTSGTVVVTTTSAVLAGYALAHLRLPGRRIVLALIVGSLFFPTRVTALIAIWQMQRRLGLANVTWGLILPYVGLGIAVSVFVMRGVFAAIPREIVDAARLDGAGAARLLVGVLAPIARNGIVVVVMMNLVGAWGEYLLASLLIADQRARTLPVVLATSPGAMGAQTGPEVAASYAITIAPELLAFALTQRWFRRGMLEGVLHG